MHQPRRKALISAITYGNKKSQTIILLPPGDGVGNHFDELSRLLSQHFFVVVVNLPGATKGACGDCTIDSIVNSICTYIDSEKILNPIVIGESYGAVIAMQISSIIALKKSY